MDLATAKRIVNGLSREDRGQGSLAPEDPRWDVSSDARSLVKSSQDIIEALIKICLDYEDRLQALEQ